MRHPLVPALLVVAVLAVYGVGGVVLADAGDAEDVTVDGTVIGPADGAAGDAVVLVGDYGLLSKLSPSELREIADDDLQDLTVVEVASNGSFSATVDRRRADAVVALGDAGVSRVVRLGNQGATLDLQVYEHRPQTVYTAAAPFAHDENRTRLYVSLVNNGDHAVENLTVSAEKLPAGWSVAGVETDGSYDAATGTVTWASLPAGAEVDTTLTLAAPVDTDVGAYEVAFAAASDTHPVTAEDATVEKHPEDTAGPTKTALGGDGGTPKHTDGTPGMTDGTTPTATPAEAPGLGLLAGLVALVGGGLSLRRRA